MILQSLVRHYEVLADQEKVSTPGWCRAKVSYALNLGPDGTLKGVIPLKREEIQGKKSVWAPSLIKVPEMVSRAFGISANFLCDNSKYFLGIDAEGSGERVIRCFEAAKRKHLEILEHVHSEAAEAVKNFFLYWEPEKAAENCEIQSQWEEITVGNLVFCMGKHYAQEDGEIQRAWEESRKLFTGENEGTCLVTGEKAEIARIHSGIRGVPGAQPSGAMLVSFNAPAFESHGKEKSYNAPVGKYAAFAYTTALNYLITQKKYVFLLGDTTVVFWAEDGKESYQEGFSISFEPEADNQESICGVFDSLKKGNAVKIEDVELDPGQKFYILGVAPNAARLSVRFFYQDSFGNILKSLSEHYERMKIVRSKDEPEFLGIRRLLWETVNQREREKKPRFNIVSGVFQAILSNGKYPESLYSSTLIRIRAEQGEKKISMGRAAIIKAFLIKNRNLLQEGDKFVGLNEETNTTAYVLGRIFAVLEEIQEKANLGINTTIRDRYFNSACATPATVFPILFKLKNSHIRKLETGRKVYYESILTALQGKLEAYPKRLNLDGQGLFILGYYHQTQKRYAKKEENKDERGNQKSI